MNAEPEIAAIEREERDFILQDDSGQLAGSEASMNALRTIEDCLGVLMCVHVCVSLCVCVSVSVIILHTTLAGKEAKCSVLSF